MPVITLTTDFGIVDEYIAVMKGVILGIYPEAVIVDITHHIPPQDLVQAAYTIRNAYAYFPRGTVHIIVVDPGVGSGRSILALEKDNHFFIAPDNGILSLLLEKTGADSMMHVTNDQYYLPSVSRTFHGRDIFAPVGAHLAKGVSLKRLGKPATQDQIVRLNIPTPEISSGEISGHIISIDHFGNLISNIDEERLRQFGGEVDFEKRISIRIKGKKITGLSKSYENNKAGKGLAVIGSRGLLEIAVSRGSARQVFKAGKGDEIRISL